MNSSTNTAFAICFSLVCAGPALAQPAEVRSPPVKIDSAAYQALSGAAKRDLLWAAIEQGGRYAKHDLPTGGAVRGALKAVWGRFTLRTTFTDDADVRRKRRKTFHRWGTSVAVRYEAVRSGLAGRICTPAPFDNPYTGVFESGAPGIARLSLGLGDVASLWAPGIGLKLFVDGKPSVNVHAIPRAGKQESKNFMAATLDTKIDATPLDGFLKFAGDADPTHRRTDHVAAVTASGAAVAEPKSPFRIEFRPGQAISYSSPPRWGSEDFRASLAKIEAGSVLYEVWAVPSADTTPDGASHIGNIRTESGFVASAFQDRRLHFQHVK